MNGIDPTAFVLNARLGWRTLPPPVAANGAADASGSADAPDRASDSGAFGIRLQAGTGAGPLSLLSADGSLGGLLLPRGFAFDARHRLCLLVAGPARWCVRRFDPAERRFRDLPRLGKALAAGEDAPRALAVAGSTLCIVEPESRTILRYDLERCRPLAPLQHASPLWQPIDLFAADERLFILAADGRIHAWIDGSGSRLEEVARRTGGAPWRRMAVDRNGLIHVLVVPERNGPESGVGTGETAFLAAFAPRGLAPAPCEPASLAPTTVPEFPPESRVRDANTVRGSFPAPWIRLWLAADEPVSRGRFFLPPDLAEPCVHLPIPTPPPEDPLALYRHLRLPAEGTTPDEAQVAAADALLFRSDGTPTTPPEPLARPLAAYEYDGVWYSAPLDSGLFDCQWDRIVIEFSRLPPGGSVEVSTFASDLPTEPALLGIGVAAEERRDRDYLWATNYTIRSDGADGAASDCPIDLLVQSRPGRYLQLRLRLHGSGQDSPVIRSIRVGYPRRSYVELLPPVFASDAQSRWFLERFLSIFQTGWDEMRALVRSADRYFMPDAVPADGHLRYLASWLAVPLQTALDADGARRLLQAAVRTYRWRGTPWAVGEMLRACLANLTRGRSSARPEFPVVVEGFRQRHRVVLDEAASGGLDGGATLWGAGVTDRLQVGVHARVGEARLLLPGDERSDYLARHANTVSIYAPACWLRDETTRRLFTMAAETECPAQSRIHIVPIEADLRVGLQSTVGLDTIIGSYPVAATAREGASAPPSHPGDLDYGPILSADPPPTGVRGNPRLPGNVPSREAGNG